MKITSDLAGSARCCCSGVAIRAHPSLSGRHPELNVVSVHGIVVCREPDHAADNRLTQHVTASKGHECIDDRREISIGEDTDIGQRLITDTAGTN